MRRIYILALFFVVLLPNCAVLAQNKVQGGMVVRKLTYHKKEKKPKKTKKELLPVAKGIQQSVNVSFNYIDEENYGGAIDYIVGYRFNNYFFAGAGVGLSYDDCGEDNYLQSSICFSNYGLTNIISIPLYTHLRAYLGKKRFQPFVALSTGAIFGAHLTDLQIRTISGSVIYSDTFENITYLVEPMLGLDVRITSGLSLNLQLGLNIHGVPYLKLTDATHARIYQKTECDFAVKLGCTF